MMYHPRRQHSYSHCRESLRSRNYFTDSQQKQGDSIKLQCGRREMQNLTAEAAVNNNPYRNKVHC
jgi:hypothetical protein